MQRRRHALSIRLFAYTYASDKKESESRNSGKRLPMWQDWQLRLSLSHSSQCTENDKNVIISE